MLHWSYILILVEVFTNWWLYVLIFIPIGCKVIEKYHSKNIVVHFWFSPQIIFVFRIYHGTKFRSSLLTQIMWVNDNSKVPYTTHFGKYWIQNKNSSFVESFWREYYEIAKTSKLYTYILVEQFENRMRELWKYLGENIIGRKTLIAENMLLGNVEVDKVSTSRRRRSNRTLHWFKKIRAGTNFWPIWKERM